MSVNKKKSVWREYAEAIIIALILAFIIRIFVVQAFKIPSRSMVPTLLVGDHLLVNKFIYDLREPRRNEVVVFKFPEDNKTDFIKRLIALPGDEVSLLDGKLFINKEPVTDEKAAYGLDGNPGTARNFGPFRVPAKGDVIYPNKYNARLYRNLVAQELEAEVEIRDGRLFVNGTFLDSHKVRKEYVFMMGDNRDNSYDSRFWGPVSMDDLVGKAMVIYWSWGGNILEGQRWKRIGDIIR